MGHNAMAFQPVLNTAEITVAYLQNVKPISNTFHAERAGGYALADIQALAANVDALVAIHFLPLQSLNARYLRTEVRGLAVENDLFALDNTSEGDGLDLSEGLPNNVTLSVKKSSGLTGRSARGRVFFIGMPDNDLSTNENQWAQTEADNVVLGVEAFRAGIVQGGWVPVIVSRFTAGAPRAMGKTFPWLSTSIVDRDVDSQRGRLN